MQRALRFLLAALVIILSTTSFAADYPPQGDGRSSMNWQFGYDNDGRITKLVDPGGKATQLQYAFDDQKRLKKLTREQADGAKAVYEFDERGRRVKMTDSLGVVRYDYDELNHLTGVRREGQPAIIYSYDTFNRVISIGVGGDFTTRYTYDFLGRLAAIDSPAGKVTYEYQSGQGKVIRMLPNGIWTEWQYGPDGALKSLTHMTKENQVILKFEYAYQPDGLIQQIKEWSPEQQKTIAYEYDKVQRLITVVDSAMGTTRYAYDPLGNRTALTGADGKTITSEYDWAGRLLKHDGQVCAHDAAGNLASCLGPQGKATCEYDAANLLKAVTTEKGRIEYQYDGQGLLVTRLDGFKKLSIVPDAVAQIWRPLLVTGTDNQRTFYVWEGQRPLAMIQGNAPSFFLEDHLGSVRCTADIQGKIVGRFNYTPFGLPSSNNGDTIVRAGFSGLFFDSGSRLYLTRARGYDPWLERFLQPDPIQRIPGGSAKLPSLYGYCDGDPLNFSDRTGAEPQSVWWGAFWGDVSQHVFDTDRATQFYTQPAIDLPETFKLSVRNAIERAPEGGTIHVLVTGVGNNWGDAQEASEQYFGLGAVGIRTGTGDTVWDALVAARDQGLGSQLHNVVWHLQYIQQIAEEMGKHVWIDLGAHSNGAIAVRNEWNLLENAIDHGLRIGSVKTYAVSSTEWLENSCRNQKIPIPFNAQARSDDPVVALTLYPRNVSQNMQKITGLPRLFTDPLAFTYVELVKIGALGSMVFGSLKHHALGTSEGYVIGEASSDKSADRKFPLLEVHLNPYEIKKSSSRLYPFFPPDDHGGGGGAAVGGRSPLIPSNVGGIALQGAGDALKQLGPLQGVALDKNGQLVLLSQEKGEFGLPPLRLDDVVTVFRSVYEQGQAPFVSIDPNPDNPRGPIMITRQAPATTNTYVQWVLFEGDRVMKTYSLGMDNVKKQPVLSSIPGYKSLLDLNFSNVGDPAREADWERFWIVPSEVNRYEATSKQLTLLDVPLKVKTERMVLRNGKMETAPNATPSQQAQAFATWFTKNYQQLCQEVRSQPPRESGLDAPVAVYAELQRIALITGIAEALRDQGTPLPAWMREYPVKPCPVPPTTPAITVEKSQQSQTQTQIRKIYGGADLGVPDKDLHTMRSAPQAESMAKALPAMVSPSEAIAPVAFEKDGKRYQALALPGSETRALRACRLEATDLAVPVQGGSGIALARRYNSFFQPSGELGRGWTLDLPRLEKWQWPVERTDRGATSQAVFALTSPLNTWCEVFAKHKLVPEVHGELLAPNGSSSQMLGLADGNDKRIGQPTHEVLFRDGQQWHFDAAGNLVAQIQAPLAVIYRRDAKHRITSIEGWHGNTHKADIQLGYDSAGRLASAHGSNGKVVKYGYDKAGALAQADRSDIILGYQYREGFITTVSQNGKTTGEFKYNERGQLLSEKQGTEKALAYRVNSTADGIQVSASEPGRPDAVESAQYDASLRPTNRVFADGAKAQWKYSDSGEVEYSAALPGGEQYRASRSADGAQATVRFDDGSRYQANYDMAGRVTRFQQGDKEAMRLEWNPDGQLGSTWYETVGLHREYKDGVLTSLLITPPEKGPNYSRWLNVEYDDQGRTRTMADYSGAKIKVDYDKNGEPAKLVAQNGTVQIERDGKGKIAAVQTSWGAAQRRTYATNSDNLLKLEYLQGKDKATIDFDHGQPIRIEQFDAGKTDISYYSEGNRNGLLKQVRTPNDVVLKYDYDSATRLSSVDCAGTYKLQLSYDAQGRLTGLAQVAASMER